MSNPATTYHRDGTVTYWDVYSQTWHRTRAMDISAVTLASLTADERRRIERLAVRQEAAQRIA